MTTTEKLKWKKKGRDYADGFFDTHRMRQTLKRKNGSLPLNPKQDHLDKYGDRLTQLELTYIRLKRFPILLSSYHAALEKKDISRVSQFIYHIENYLSLIYIFDQRIRRLVKLIEKLDKKHPCLPADTAHLLIVKNSLIGSLKPLVLIRDDHIHDRYFNDSHLEEIVKYDKAGDFTTTLIDKKEFKKLANKLLTIERKKWTKDISSNIENFEIQLGLLYHALDKLVWQLYRKL